MKIPLTRSWIPLLLAGLLFPAVVVRGASDPSDTDPTVFGDGIFKKFNLDLGFAGRTHRWSIYTYGAGTSISPFTALDVSGSSKKILSVVDSDVALAGSYSRLSVSNYGRVNGDRYEQTTSSETTSGNGFIGGSRISNASTNSLLNGVNGGVTSLQNVSNNAFGLAATSGTPNISLSGGSMTINNNPFGGKYVLNLTNFVLDNKSVLTLKGVAGSAFVINVSNNFSLSNQSRIELAGGLTPSDVLFNVRGSSGTFSIASGSLFQGTLLAYNNSSSSTQRTLTVSGANTRANGELLANKVIVSNGGHVKKPKKKSRDDDDDGDHDHR